jgi:8-oxo-dGTP diphosphatase
VARLGLRGGARPLRPGFARFEEIDWSAWEPQQRATLLFVIRDGCILLIRKKRGLGAGKINGPGGRIGPGETPLECAIREVQEELRVTPKNVSYCGELRFQFVDGLSLHGYVFKASDCDGEPCETEEATPLWTPIDAIPYAEMWADDRLWVPLMLAGIRFDGRFLFDGDRMLGHRIESR